ncbi:hypothetical protein [Fodinicurvata halophila]|uniref:hypothetical protein n=1 Tax=Fodinicurvata halophila TaxID=1419723 RepID=UPI00363708EA
MLLRTRISLIFLLGLVILALGLLLASDLRERETEERFTEVAVTGQKALWQQLVTGESTALATLETPIRSDRGLARAVEERARAAIGSAMRRLVSDSELAPDVLEITNADGELVYSSRTGIDTARTLDLTSLAEVADGTSLSGLWQDRGDRFLVVHAFPLRAPAGGASGDSWWSRWAAMPAPCSSPSPRPWKRRPTW